MKKIIFMAALYLGGFSCSPKFGCPEPKTPGSPNHRFTVYRVDTLKNGRYVARLVGHDLRRSLKAMGPYECLPDSLRQGSVVRL